MLQDSFERIRTNNPWWGNVDAINQDSLVVEFEEQKIKYFHPLLSGFPSKKDGVLTIRGPRRVGKSTLFRLLIRLLLLEKGVPPESVFFFPCDRVEDYNDLFNIIKTYLDFARPRTNQRLFIFLDEISFVTDWQKTIKEMTDVGLLKNSLTLLTGSSLLDLKFGSEFLSGRRGNFAFPDIFYYPLNFRQFVQTVEPKFDINQNNLELSYHLPKLQKIFSDYLLTGGFMTAINDYYQTGRIKQSFYETFLSWIENDLHKARRSEKTAYDLIANIFRTLTTQISFTSLARDTNLASQLAIQEYLDILEKMFLLFTLEAKVVEQNKRDPRKNKKIYFTDPFIFNVLYIKTHELMGDSFAQIRDALKTQMPIVAENMVALDLKQHIPNLYWGKSAKGEIDFITSKRELFEVKYQEKIDLSLYYEHKNFKNLKIISKKTFAEKPFSILPLELFLLQNSKIKIPFTTI